MKKILKYIWIPLCSLVLLFSSCSSSTKLFESGKVSANQLAQFALRNPPAPVLSPGDKVIISIWGHDELSIGSINTQFTTVEETGRWVVLDNEGQVNLPKVGRVKLDGFNLKEAAYFLEQRYKTHVKDPIINVRVLNHFITVLGEVNAPGKYLIDNEKITLVTLLGEAKGFTDYAKPRQVQLIREVNGIVQNYEIDLTQIESLKNKNAVLQPGDIVYVPSEKNKQTDEFLTKAVPVASILTAVAVIYSVFKK